VNPKALTAEFVSFLGRPNNCTPEDVSFQIDRQNMTWLPNVDNPLAENANLSGMSGGPCFRRSRPGTESSSRRSFTKGAWDIGVIFARQACLITASGELAAVPPGVRQRTLRPREDE
jgi:hypothetical protein